MVEILLPYDKPGSYQAQNLKLKEACFGPAISGIIPSGDGILYD